MPAIQYLILVEGKGFSALSLSRLFLEGIYSFPKHEKFKVQQKMADIIKMVFWLCLWVTDYSENKSNCKLFCLLLIIKSKIYLDNYELGGKNAVDT
jgi:hypothetical protein